jgi:hypothetical protein
LTTNTYQPPGAAANQIDLLSSAYDVLVNNLPGISLLVLLSALFSTINFYAALRDRGIGFGATTRYLVGWIFVNFLLSLLILILILPPDMTLDHVDRTIFVYCLLATAIPEIATNIKVQMGDTTRGIDLYKYKKQVSRLIMDRAGVTGSLRQALRFQCLTYYYHDHKVAFEERMSAFAQQEHFSGDEQQALETLFQQIRASHGAGPKPFQPSPQLEAILPRLIEYFADDINDYLQTSEAKLMRGLRYAHTSIDDVRNLVRAGVLSPAAFFRRMRSTARRKQLADTTGIAEQRLEEIYFQSLRPFRTRRRSRYVWLGSTACVLLAAVFLVIQVARNKNYLPGYAPSSIPVAAASELKDDGLSPQYESESTP